MIPTLQCMVGLAAALASAFTGRPLRGGLAMTGEITLSGQVLPVGGIRDKVLAAHRCGLTCVILPHRNRQQIDEKLGDDLPPHARSPLRDRHRGPAGPGPAARAGVSGAAPSSRGRPVPATVIRTRPCVPLRRGQPQGRRRRGNVAGGPAAAAGLVTAGRTAVSPAPAHFPHELLDVAVVPLGAVLDLAPHRAGS